MNLLKSLVVGLAVVHLTLATSAAATLAPQAPTSPAQHSAPTAAAKPAANPDIRDIRGPIYVSDVPVSLTYLVGAVVLAAALYAAWCWYRAPAKERVKEAHEIALERLEKARALMAPGQAREYSFAVSEITRTYIEARFQERANRRTTEEFLRDLLAREKAGLSAHRAQLEDFLRYCDLAKFARWQFSASDMESMHESARVFILETRPQPAASQKRSLPGAVSPSAGSAQLTHARP